MSLGRRFAALGAFAALVVLVRPNETRAEPIDLSFPKGWSLAAFGFVSENFLETLKDRQIHLQERDGDRGAEPLTREEDFQPRRCYWAHSPKDAAFSVGGERIEESPFDLALAAGWNLVGNPFKKPLLPSINLSATSNGFEPEFFDFRDGEYIRADGPLEPGRCYWVKAGEDMALTVSPPACGNGAVDWGEACDAGSVSQACEPDYGERCERCTDACRLETLDGGHCGDGLINGGEQCDAGAENTGEGCPSGYEQGCTYCDLRCRLHIELDGWCGDGVINGDEECDEGKSNANDPCSPEYGSTCNWCDADCREREATGPRCGDGAVNGKETCDNGADNTDEACKAGYGETCAYCTTSCDEMETSGGFCGDGVANGSEECDFHDNGDSRNCDESCHIKLMNPSWERFFSNQTSNLHITTTTDAGYLLVGNNYFHIPAMFWLLKLTSDGEVSWEKDFSNTNDEQIIHSVQPIADGGFVLAGERTERVSGPNESPKNSDALVIKLDNNGDVLWRQVIGGVEKDYAKSIRQTSDGGFIVAGGKKGDFWVFKLDADGAIVWENSYDRGVNEEALEILQKQDGGYIVAGNASFDLYDPENHWSFYQTNIWLLRLDSEGILIWDKKYDGSLVSINATSDNGYVVLGNTAPDYSSADVMKLDSRGNISWIWSENGFRNLLPVSYLWPTKIYEKSEGIYVLVKNHLIWPSPSLSTRFNPPSGYIYGIALDNSGREIWSKRWDGQYGLIADGFLLETDGSVVLAGRTSENWRFLTSSAWVYKFNMLDSE